MKILALFLSFFLCFATALCAEQTLQVYFSPDERVDLKLIEQIENEKKSIHAAIYCLSHSGIEKALVKAKERGIPVEIIVDPFSLKQRGICKRLHRAGVPLFVFKPKSVAKNQRAALMHDKFCVFGEDKVWTGSFNFTHAASLVNRENALLFTDPAVAKRFEEQFQRMKKEHCQPYSETLHSSK
jgi:phosphatidylserine/phosphatidylglycerophosphate/cardiolipin synthase-like enzyme